MFLFHTMELIHCIRQPRPIHAMNKDVPMFRATAWTVKHRTLTIRTRQLTFKVPVHGNSTYHKANERKRGIQLIRGWLHCSFWNLRMKLEQWAG